MKNKQKKIENLTIYPRNFRNFCSKTTAKYFIQNILLNEHVLELAQNINYNVVLLGVFLGCTGPHRADHPCMKQAQSGRACPLLLIAAVDQNARSHLGSVVEYSTFFSISKIFVVKKFPFLSNRNGFQLRH